MVRLLKKWVAQPADGLAVQVPRALAAAVLAALVDFACLIGLVELAHWDPAIAAIAGYLLGGVVQYTLCSLWVFQQRHGNILYGFLVFTLLSLVGLGITWAIMEVNRSLQLPYLFAKCFAMGLAFSWNFLSRKLLIFAPAANPIPVTTLCDFSEFPENSLLQPSMVPQDR